MNLNNLSSSSEAVKQTLVKALFVITSAVLVAGFFYQVLLPMKDHDIWWQLSYGEAMAQSKSIIKTDILSHTLFGAEWITIGWLGQIFLYGVYSLFGFAGIFIWKIVFCICSILMMIQLVKQTEVRTSWKFYLAWFGFSVVYFRFNERLELFTLIFFPLFTYLLLKSRKSISRENQFIPWILFVLMVFWVNIHAGFVYGISLVGCLSLGARLSGEKKAYVKMLDQSLVLTSLATLINPNGIYLYSLFFQVVGHLASDIKAINEYLPPKISWYPFFWIAMGLAICSLGWDLVKKDKKIRFWVPLVIFFSICGAKYTRCVPMFGFVAIPFFGFLINRPKGWIPFQVNKTIFVLVLSAIWTLWGFILIQQRSYHHTGTLVNWSRFPTKASQFINENKIPGKMYNSFNWGGYLYWALGPERKIFMDGRYIFHSFAIEDIRINREMQSNPFENRWENYFNQYDVNYTIEQRRNVKYEFPDGEIPFRMSRYNLIYPRSKWALIFWDDASFVFIRRIPENEQIIEKFEYKTLRPYNLDQMNYLFNEGLIKKNDIEEELERHLKLVGETRTRRKILSIF